MSMNKKELIALISELAATLATYVEPCDHSVNICFCEDRRLLERANEVVEKAQAK